MIKDSLLARSLGIDPRYFSRPIELDSGPDPDLLAKSQGTDPTRFSRPIEFGNSVPDFRLLKKAQEHFPYLDEIRGFIPYIFNSQKNIEPKLYFEDSGKLRPRIISNFSPLLTKLAIDEKKAEAQRHLDAYHRSLREARELEKREEVRRSATLRNYQQAVNDERDAQRELLQAEAGLTAARAKLNRATVRKNVAALTLEPGQEFKIIFDKTDFKYLKERYR